MPGEFARLARKVRNASADQRHTMIIHPTAESPAEQHSCAIPAGSRALNGVGDGTFEPPPRPLGARRHATSVARFARIGPVHFQPLEWELEALRSYFGGRALNAGCGNRDISGTLKDFGAKEVVNYDIASE